MLCKYRMSLLEVYRFWSWIQVSSPLEKNGQNHLIIKKNKPFFWRQRYILVTEKLDTSCNKVKSTSDKMSTSKYQHEEFTELKRSVVSLLELKMIVYFTKKSRQLLNTKKENKLNEVDFILQKKRYHSEKIYRESCTIFTTKIIN